MMGRSTFLFLFVGLYLCFITHTGAGDPKTYPFSSCNNCNIDSVVWAPNSVVFLLTTNATVFRSTDEGVTWTKLYDSIFNLVQYPTDPNTVVLQSNTRMYITKDGGSTFSAATYPTYLSSMAGFMYLEPHPNSTNAVMLTCSQFEDCQEPLIYSLDNGNTWKATSFNVLMPGQWGSDYATSNTYVIFTLSTQYQFGYFLPAKDVFTPILANSFGFVLTRQFMWVGVDMGVESALYASSSNLDPSHTVKSLYFHSQFPDGDGLTEHSYTILDDSAGSGFIAHWYPYGPWGTIFESEYEGRSFVLSLSHAGVYNGLVDFDRVHGIEGVYVANVVLNYNQPSASPTKQTVISFDNGGDWRRLTPPAKDAKGNPITCAPPCSLNLHGLTSYYASYAPPFYSSGNAIGVLVAVGNVGTQLSNNQDDQKTYLSRDAGLTWLEIIDESTIYEIGDHGGIIVFAAYGRLTDQVWYTFDEGLTMKTFQFSNLTVDVDNIIIEEDGTGLRFIIWGSAASKHYIYTLDFTGVQPRMCGDDDYEVWQPSDGEHGTDHCIMGQTKSYSRRKRESACYNDRGYDHLNSVTPCECDFEDYECDAGFTPTPRNSTDGFECLGPRPAPNCTAASSYIEVTGYHVIVNDMCQGGLDLNPKNKTCVTPVTTGVTTGKATTGSATTGGHHHDNGNGLAVAITVTVIVTLLVAGAIGFAVYRKPTLLGNFLGFFRKKDTYSAVSQEEFN